MITMHQRGTVSFLRMSGVVSCASAVALLLVLSGAEARTSDREDATAAPSRSGWPMVVVRSSGGFRLANASALRPLPHVYVTADGRLIGPGRAIAVRPVPALPSLRVRTLSRSGLARLRELAAEARIDRAPPGYGRPPVADATTTEIVYRAASGRTFVHRVYALGHDAGVSAEQRDARRRVRRLVDVLGNPARTFGAGELGAERPYTIAAFEIAANRQESVQEPLPGAFPWPLRPVPLAQAQACTPVTGPDAEALRRALRGTSAFTQWLDDGAAYLLRVRPVLPGELPCP